MISFLPVDDQRKLSVKNLLYMSDFLTSFIGGGINRVNFLNFTCNVCRIFSTSHQYMQIFHSLNFINS